jgi:hypothetical protein
MGERDVDEAWPPAISLQGRVANHRERLPSKASVVSVAEKVPEGIRWEPMKANTRELPFKCRNSETTSKPGVDVSPG